MLVARSYTSPTLVLLAFDYSEGESQEDFLGFTIKRTPGFDGAPFTFLPNRIGFNGPPPDGTTKGSDIWPIQKFYWWDAQINTPDRGKTFRYTIQPARGKPDAITLDDGITIDVTVNELVEQGIGTYFNRAVVSSQAFVRTFGHNPTGDLLRKAYIWLGNGMEQVVQDFLGDADKAKCDIEGAIYHLSQSDEGDFIIPAMAAFKGNEDLVYHANDDTDRPAIRQLKPAGVTFSPRTKTHIMHDKFLVAVKNDAPQRVVMGSANYTTEGLTQQANLMHTWNYPELATLYLQRKKLIEPDPSIADTSKAAAWSDAIRCGDADVRVFFPPEPRKRKGASTPGQSIDAVIEAVQKAKSSAIFCLFAPTDMDLLDAFFKQIDDKRMVLGLMNTVPETEPVPNKAGHLDPVKVAIYDRSKVPSQLTMAGHSAFGKGSTPEGFSWEDSQLGSQGAYPVYVHHKFVVVDAETAHPIIYTGSANMSANSVFYNDENLLEITDCPRLAQIYLAEFMRLFEHYRARLAFHKRQTSEDKDTFFLTSDNQWAKDWYGDTSKSLSRTEMAKPLT